MARYAGDLSASAAWELIREKKAVVIDVRTQPEWSFVGTPDLRPLGERPVFLSWQTYPSMAIDADFVSKVKARIGDDLDRPLLFLCRSGARSAAAAAAVTEAGFRQCYNIAHGFEGDKDTLGRRGQVNGWKAEGQPWQQE